MSDVDSTLTRSPSGVLRPQRRPPINRSSNNINSKSTKEETTDFLKKESSFNNITTNEMNTNEEEFEGEAYYNENTELGKEDEEESNFSHDCTDTDFDNSQKEFEEDNEQEFTDTLLEEEPVTDEREDYPQRQKEDNNNPLFYKYVVDNRNLLAVVPVLILLIFNFRSFLISAGNTEDASGINVIREEFPTQLEDLWTSFEAGVQDVVKFDRPSTFIFLYNKEAEDTMEDLLEKLLKYAVCKIKDCFKKPIIVTDTELNSPDIIEDYGRIIDRYKNKLEENGVMVIKHLENVRGISAQAFHSFCDEVTPLVAKSLFIFTMEIDKIDNESRMKFIEGYLKNKWTDIKYDTFNALVTRITSMALEIKP